MTTPKIKKKKKTKQKPHHTPQYKAKISRLAFEGKAKSVLKKVQDNVDDLIAIRLKRGFKVKLNGETLGYTEHLDRIEYVYIPDWGERHYVNWKFGKCLPEIV